LSHALGISFGPDGDLYVACGGYDHNGKITDLAAVLRFHGPSGPNPGAFVDAFVPHSSGGLLIPLGILFGPDGNGDGHQDLYVNSQLFVGSFGGKNSTNAVLRYDGVTGAFIDTFVTTDSGGLRSLGIMAFTETDPTTLAFAAASKTASTGASASTLASASKRGAFPSTEIKSAALGGVLSVWLSPAPLPPPAIAPATQQATSSPPEAGMPDGQTTAVPATAHRRAAPPVVIDQFFADLLTDPINCDF
jgi:hypothetical protein